MRLLSGGHCTHPTGGPAIRLKHKKTMLKVDVLQVFISTAGIFGIGVIWINFNEKVLKMVRLLIAAPFTDDAVPFTEEYHSDSEDDNFDSEDCKYECETCRHIEYTI
jgi:hypothetical protein